MHKESFDTLLSIVGPKIRHSVNHAFPISTTQRLAITLR